MKQQLKYFGLGMLAFATITLFINATVDSTNKYFPFFKAGSTSQNLALPIQTAYAVKLPESVTFAGEQVPLDDPEVRERLDRELTVNAYWQSSTILMFKRANRFFPLIEKILKEEDVPDDFKYLCMAESALDNVSSPAGASGFWQFLSSTGSQYGLLINSQTDERYNLEKATRAACKYLRSSKESTGSWTAAAAGYNMGVAGVNKQ
ncbi:MAG TPA: lytic transglycosylase domain-containing protein, partial [Chitinophagales bacterium]|nr:lytic transglycosylase domain-containing protein [Chitinophagales bacterium]